MTTKKKTASPAVRAAAAKLALANVSNAAYTMGSSQTAAIEALRLAGCKSLTKEATKEAKAKQTAIKVAFQSAYIGARLKSNADQRERIAEGAAILAAKGKDATGLKKSERKRTPDEERLYGAARTAWHGVLKAGGFVTVDGRGGKRGANTKPKAAKPTDKATPAPKLTKQLIAVKVKDRPAIVERVQMIAAAAALLSDKNAAIIPPQLSSAIADFNAAVKAFTA